MLGSHMWVCYKHVGKQSDSVEENNLFHSLSSQVTSLFLQLCLLCARHLLSTCSHIIPTTATSVDGGRYYWSLLHLPGAQPTDGGHSWYFPASLRYTLNSFTTLCGWHCPVVNKWITQMSFLMAEFPTLFELLVLLVHVSNRLFVAYDVEIVTPSGAVLSIKSEVVDSVYLKRGQPCSWNQVVLHKCLTKIEPKYLLPNTSNWIHGNDNFH